MSGRSSLDDLWRACNAAGDLRLLVFRAPHPAKGIALSTPFAVLGREDPCDVLLDGPEVSRRHTYLQLVGGRLWGFDLLSRTGSWWGERRQEVGCFATDGLRIGPFQVQSLDPEYLASTDLYPGDSAHANPTLALPAEQDVLPTATLEFLNAHNLGGGDAVAWQLDRLVTFVGHSQHCKIRLKCPSVSRIHCSLLRTAQGVWVVDLLGKDRVLVNGMQVRWARLDDGDQLKVGRFEVRIRTEARRSAAAGPAQAGPVLTAAPGADVSRSLVDVSRPDRPVSAAGPGGSLLAGFAPPGLTPPGFAPPGFAPPAPMQPAFGMNALAAPLDPTQTMLLTVMNQFSCMQQQMFDQFQQTTMMMMQMFGNLQREQFDVVRQELDGLRELNVQIHTLQTELERHRAAPATASAPVQRPAVPAASVLGVPKPAAAWPEVAGPKAAPGPGAPRPSPGAGKPQPVAAGSPAAPETAPAGEDVHAWLAQRFTDLQAERQSRWQKLFGTLMGKA